MHKIKCVVCVCIMGSLISCASLGTRVQIYNPHALSTVKIVAIWPTAVIPLLGDIEERHPELVDSMLHKRPFFREAAEYLSQMADSCLARELISNQLFSNVISADSIITLIYVRDSNFSRYDRVDWKEYQDIIDAEYLVFTQLSFGEESGGVNSYVTLTLFDRNTGDTVVQAKFNTKWGKSYFLPQQVDKTLPDAIHGAVDGLANTIRKH